MGIWADDERPPPVVRLPEVLDADGATRLAGEILGLRGQPLAVDASAVRRIGAQGLQLLLAARKTWAADGVTLTVYAASPAFEEAMRLFDAPWRASTAARGWIDAA
jgi:chemotaxis protein CheX